MTTTTTTKQRQRPDLPRGIDGGPEGGEATFVEASVAAGEALDGVVEELAGAGEG